MEDKKKTLKLAEDLAKNVLEQSANTALEVLGLSEKEAISAMSISGAVDKALAAADTEAAAQAIRAAEVLAFLELKKAEETAVEVLETAEVEAVNVLAMAETMLSYAKGQLETSITGAAHILKSSEELSASELLVVEKFDADNLSDTQNELLVHMDNHHELVHQMQGGYSMQEDVCSEKKETFEKDAKDLKDARRIKAATLKQHQAKTAKQRQIDTASTLLRIVEK